MDAQFEGGLEKARTQILKVYNSVEESSEWEEVTFNPETGGTFNPNIPTYIEPTEMGYAGLEPPVG